MPNKRFFFQGRKGANLILSNIALHKPRHPGQVYDVGRHYGPNPNPKPNTYPIPTNPNQHSRPYIASDHCSTP